MPPRLEPKTTLQPTDDKLNPIHILLVCLLVVVIIFGGSIALSVMYVENTHGIQTDQPPEP
jgi:hypothetical protein